MRSYWEASLRPVYRRYPFFKRPKVGVFSTGDELVDPGVPPTELQPGQNLRFKTVLPCSICWRTVHVNYSISAVSPTIQNKSKLLFSMQRSSVMYSSPAAVYRWEMQIFITSTIASLGQIDFWKLNLKTGQTLSRRENRRLSCFWFAWQSGFHHRDPTLSRKNRRCGI